MTSSNPSESSPPAKRQKISSPDDEDNDSKTPNSNNDQKPENDNSNSTTTTTNNNESDDNTTDDASTLLGRENLLKAFASLHALIQQKNELDSRRTAEDTGESPADAQLLKFLNDYDYLFFAQHPDTLESVSHYIISQCVTSYDHIIKKLVGEMGAPWNFVDKNEVSLGDLLLKKGNQELYDWMVDHGVRTELILRALNTKSKTSLANMIHAKDEEIDHDAFLKQKLIFKDGVLLDEQGNGVMMNWKGPLMVEHAKVLCERWEQEKQNGTATEYSVLNVGFGLGLIDEELQKYKPTKHVIIEAHPDVYAKMIEDQWDKKPGVEILFGKWQDFIHQLPTFDGIFFDTFGEDYDALGEFHDHLPNILDAHGTYSFFNGLAARNQFFHEVSRKVAELDLLDMAIRTEYKILDMKVHDSEWEGTRDKYWKLDKYWLPVCKFDI